MKEIVGFIELDRFLKENKDYNFYLSDTIKRHFTKFSNLPDAKCYLLKTDEQLVKLEDVIKNKIEVVKVDLKED
jgi:hypothetical protein